MNKIKTLYIFAAVLAVVSVHAQDNRTKPEKVGPLMQAIDTNGDGALQQNEIDMAVSALRALDTNQDGTVSAEELGQSPASKQGSREGRPGGQRGGPGLARLDADGDGNISKEEAPERLKERFDMIDSNGDGVLDKTEQEQLMKRMRERGQQGDRNRQSGMYGNAENTTGGEKPKRPAPIE